MKIVDIAEFKPRKREQAALECACTRQDFYINEDMTVECRGCGIIMNSARVFDPRSHTVVPKNENL